MEQLFRIHLLEEEEVKTIVSSPDEPHVHDYEELLIGNNVSETSHTRIMRAEESMIAWDELETMLNALLIAIKDDDFEQIRIILQQAVAGFEPQCEISDLLWQQHHEH